MGQKINPNFFRLNYRSALLSKIKGNSLTRLPINTFKYLELKNFLYNFFNNYKLIIVSLDSKQSEDLLLLSIKYYTTEQFISFYKNQIVKLTINDTKLKKNNYGSVEDHFVKKLSIPLRKFFNQKNIRVVLYNLNKKKIPCINSRLEKNTFKKLLMQLRKFNKFSFFEDCLNSIMVVLRSSKSSRILSEFLSKQFEIVKRHNLLLNFLKRALTLFIYSMFSCIKGVKILIKGRLNGKPRSSHKLIQIGKVALQTFDSKVDFTCGTAFSSFGTFGVKVWICSKKSM